MASAESNDDTLNIHQIADILRCSPSTVRRRHKDGALPTFKIGGPTSPILARRSELKKYMKRKGKR